jgi:maltose alpha-D-glucosyltransferase/alpha-amylase
MRDLASMVTSIYDVTYEGFFINDQIPVDDTNVLMPFAEQWAFFMSNIFLNSYFENLHDIPFLPKIKEDKEMFVETYLLERALNQLNFELVNRPERVIVPLKLIIPLIK